MFWVNVDKLTEIWKLHKETCRHCKPNETKLKGVNKMKDNGRWFKYETYQDAYRYYETKHGTTGYWQTCKVCNPEKT